MKIRINFEFNFWKWLISFAYKKYTKSKKIKNISGIPGIRDFDNQCPSYAPRDKKPGDWDNCQSDGHYMCKECCHLAEENIFNTPVEKLSE